MDNLRIKFLPGQQNEFIERIYMESKLSTKELANIVGIHRRSFSDWRRDKLNMTLFAAELFCKRLNINLPEEKTILIDRWRKAKTEAGRIGGIALFKKHGSPATLEGRRKGGIKTLANLRRNGIIPIFKIYNSPSFSVELAEYVGIMLGDGGITSGQCAITLNSVADHDYVIFVSLLAEKLFGEAPKTFKRKHDKAIVLYYSGVRLVEFLVKIGLKIGNKVRQQVDVPDWVKNSKKYRIACLRGLMDTDGGVFLHKYKVNLKVYSYRKICFSNRSIPLLIFVKSTLEELGFTAKVIDKVENKKVWLYNTNEVGEYLKKVGTNNPRLLKHGG